MASTRLGLYSILISVTAIESGLLYSGGKGGEVTHRLQAQGPWGGAVVLFEGGADAGWIAIPVAVDASDGLVLIQDADA